MESRSLFIVTALLVLALPAGGCQQQAAQSPKTTAVSSTSTQDSTSSVPAAIRRALEGRIAAVNKGDGKSAGQYYATNAAMEELDVTPPLVTTGRSAIGDRLQYLAGEENLRMKATGDPIMHDRYVAEPVSFSQASGPGHGEGMLVFEFDREGKISHQWVIGWVE